MDLSSHIIMNKVPPKDRRVLEAIMFCSAWVLWKERNKVVMKGKKWSGLSVLSAIKALSHLWISTISPKCKLPGYSYRFHLKMVGVPSNSFFFLFFRDSLFH